MKSLVLTTRSIDPNMHNHFKVPVDHEPRLELGRGLFKQITETCPIIGFHHWHIFKLTACGSKADAPDIPSSRSTMEPVGLERLVRASILTFW